jgi:Replication-relaxation
MQLRKAWEKLIIALAELDYLTTAQITRLLYSPASLTHVREQMKLLVENGYVLPLGGRTVNLPLIYTLSSTGRQYASLLGVPPGKRVRPSEEADKGHNPYFLKHTMAVTDVLISARLLSQQVPGIVLNRIYTERELRRRIYVEIAADDTTQHRTICLEPDASCDFTIQDKWRDFFHIEVYRNLPPAEWRFKQKIAGYVAYLDSGNHEALFHTSALSIAAIAVSKHMAEILKRWTEEALQKMGRPEEGDWFFFCSLDVASATPEELFLSPVWEQAFGAAKTPLLMLEEETK